MARGRVSWTWVVIGALAVVACHQAIAPAKEGEACRELGASVCRDPGHVLTCREFSWKLGPCRGERGCTPSGALAQATCDRRVVELGDPCDADGVEACATDGHELLRCTDAHMIEIARCDGPGACSARGEGHACDDSVAKKGDLCRMIGSAACTADGRLLLVCAKGHFVSDTVCRGEAGCRVEGDQPTCDAGIAVEGDPCSQGGVRWCSQDRKLRLRCSAFGRGHFVLDGRCGGKKGCFAESDAKTVGCDRAFAEIGDSCTQNFVACTRDGKKRLACEAGEMRVAEACAHVCKVDEDDGGWRCY